MSSTSSSIMTLVDDGLSGDIGNVILLVNGGGGGGEGDGGILYSSDPT